MQCIALQRRLLRVSWTARRSNQSILKEINLEYSLARLKLKLKHQSFGHLMQRADSFEKTLMLGKTEGKRRKWCQRMRQHDGLNGHELEQTPGASGGKGSLACCSPWGRRVRYDQSTEQQQQIDLNLIYVTALSFSCHSEQTSQYHTVSVFKQTCLYFSF